MIILYHTSPPKVVLVVLQFIHDPNTTGRPIGVDNVHNSQCLDPVFMHLNIAVIHLIVFTIGTGVHHVCQTRGLQPNPLLQPKLLLEFHWTFPDPQQFSFSRNSGNETSNRLQGYTFQFDNLQFSQLQIVNFEFTIFINCQNPNSTTSKPQPNCSWRLDTKMTVQTPPPPTTTTHPTETQFQQYLRCY